MIPILKPVIYVAGPYSADTRTGIKDNIARAEDAGVKLMNAGWAVHIPHKNTAHMGERKDLKNLGWEAWLVRDFAILARCDAIYLLKAWKDSPGACAEWGFVWGYAAAVEAARFGTKLHMYVEADGVPEAVE